MDSPKKTEVTSLTSLYFKNKRSQQVRDYAILQSDQKKFIFLLFIYLYSGNDSGYNKHPSV